MGAGAPADAVKATISLETLSIGGGFVTVRFTWTDWEPLEQEEQLIVTVPWYGV
jgi:hypothetical protein